MHYILSNTAHVHQIVSRCYYIWTRKYKFNFYRLFGNLPFKVLSTACIVVTITENTQYRK